MNYKHTGLATNKIRLEKANYKTEIITKFLT